MKPLRACVPFLLASLLLPCGTAAAGVIVVDGNDRPGTDFTQLQPAIDAAADGDVLLLCGNTTYLEGIVVNKALTIAGVESESSSVRPVVRMLSVSGLQAGKSVVVRDVDVQNTGVTGFFDVVDCAGAVLFESCRIDASAYSDPPVIPAALVTDSTNVLFTRCLLEGAQGIGSPGVGPEPVFGGPGLVVEASAVTLYDCEVSGGDGQDAFFYLDQPFLPVPSSAGGQGVQVWSGTLNLVGTSVRGGAGGDGSEPLPGQVQCLPPSGGGAGVRTYGTVRQLDADLSGGAAGASVTCAAAAGAGQPLVVLAGGAVMSIPEGARSLELGSVLENGGTCSVALRGAPGEMVTLLLSFTPLASWHVGLKGALAGQPPYVTALLGPLDGNGELAFDVPLAANLLPAAVDSLSFTAQAIAAASSGGGLLSSPTSVVLVHELPFVP